jgi:hypothetical protein
VLWINFSNSLCVNINAAARRMLLHGSDIKKFDFSLKTISCVLTSVLCDNLRSTFPNVLNPYIFQNTKTKTISSLLYSTFADL